MFIGDGAKLVRDAFALAKEKSPCIIFIDEIDAIGTKRFDSEVSGDREVQRTMLELLNQLDGFSSDASIKVGINDKANLLLCLSVQSTVYIFMCAQANLTLYWSWRRLHLVRSEVVSFCIANHPIPELQDCDAHMVCSVWHGIWRGR